MIHLLRPIWRSSHRWFSILVVLPFSLTLVTGLLLSSRSFVPWVQPGYPPSPGRDLKVTFDEMLEAVRRVPQARMQSWGDIAQIDVRPQTGLVRLRAKQDQWEVLLDASSGAVLQVAKRRVSWLTSLHEGAYFGSAVRYGIFFPSAVGVLFLVVSGLVLFAQPSLRRLRARRAKT